MSLDKWDLMATHGLRQYVWHLLKTELGWSETNYHDPNRNFNYVPIVTPEQQPEMNQFSAPYIVYAYSQKMTGNLYALQGEIASFSVYASDTKDINSVLNLLNARLNKRDESAREINAFISSSTLDQQYKNFDYKTLWVSGAQGPSPVVEEGGRRDGLINVNITYTHYDTEENGTGLAIR